MKIIATELKIGERIVVMVFEDYVKMVEEKKMTVGAACKELGISRQTWYNYLNKKNKVPGKPGRPMKNPGDPVVKRKIRPRMDGMKCQARLTAEAKMAELDEIAPRLAEARCAYYKVWVEYVDRLEYLHQYKRRGHITEEEYDRYKIKNLGFETNVNRALKEYRRNKKG